MIRALLLVCALASAASADVWQRAIDSSDATKDRYDLELARGDELALRANARSQNRVEATKRVDEAIGAYRAAAALRPTQGEPYFRIATVLESFFIDCDTTSPYAITAPPSTCPPNRSSIELARTTQAVAAWDAFEKLSPLDPRLSDVLFTRAIMRTKLVDTGKDMKRNLEGALADYTSLLDHSDGLTRVDLEQVWGNLAETYMMLGNLDEAIDAYRTAIRMGASASTAYGLAVALDRDENTAEAMRVIRAQQPRDFLMFRQAFIQQTVFYVPKGEEYYYFALILEALGYDAEAISNWKQFLSSGAQPQYQPRAKKHLDDLVTKQRTQPSRPRPELDPNDLYP